MPLIVSQVNPDDGEWHEGIIANPNCSTMQLVPVLMALRDTVGLERVVVDTYQSVSGTGAEALAELESQIRAHVAGEPKVASVYPHPIAFNALPEIDVFLENGYTPRGVEGRHREPQDPAPAGSAGLVHGRASARLREPLRGRPRRDEQADHPRRGPTRLRRRARRGRHGRSREPRLPDRHPGRRAGTRSSSAASGPIHPSERGLAFWVVSDNLRKGAATNAVEIAEVLLERGWVKARLAATGRAGPGQHRDRAPSARRRSMPSRAEVAVCTRCRLHEGRTNAVPGEGTAATEVIFVGEGPGFNEDRQGRPFVGQAGALLERAARLRRLASRGGLHHQRREVPPAGEPRPGAGRDRRLRAVSDAAARGAGSGPGRHAGPLLDGSLQSRGPDRAGSRHVPAGRPRVRRAGGPDATPCTTRPRPCTRARSKATLFRTCEGVPLALVEARRVRAERCADRLAESELSGRARRQSPRAAGDAPLPSRPRRSAESDPTDHSSASSRMSTTDRSRHASIDA